MIVTSTICPLLKFGLRIFGIWPDVPFTFLRQLIYMSILLPIQYFQYRYVYLMFKRGQLEDLTDCLPGTVFYSFTGLKLLIMWKNHRIVRELLATMDSDWREYMKVDQHLHVMVTKANVTRLCTHFVMGASIASTLLYFGGDTFFAYVKTLLGYNITSRPLPVRVLLPFDAEQSPVYELIVLLLYVQSVSITYLVNIFSTFLFSLVYHACGQIEIVCQELKGISGKTSHYGSVAHTRMLIEGHNKVITFSENIENLYSYISLLQVFGNTIVFCFLGLVLMISETIAVIDQFKICFSWSTISLDIFIFCYVGELLRFQSKSLGDAGYDSLWYNMSPSHGKNILFIILKSQKQLIITVGGLTDLSLEAFTSIIKAAASYMSVLNAMYSYHLKL